MHCSIISDGLLRDFLETELAEYFYNFCYLSH